MKKRDFLPGQLRLIIAIAMVHAVAWFAYYSQIPAGQYPGEQARITLNAAQALAEGMPTQVSEHSLYTYILSLLALFFGDTASLTSAARGLNALALAVATGFCASAAGHYWQRNRAVWIAGLFVGLNPVLALWAGEVSPSLLATACMSIAIWRLLRWLRKPKRRDNIWIGISLTLAATFETTLLPFALLWPALAFFNPPRERVKQLIFALIPLATIASVMLVSKLQLQDPLQWNSDAFGLGIYQALGSQESYDDKSFSLYRQLHLILFLNPIHWGALLILASLGAYARVKDGHREGSILLAISMLAIFAVSFAINDSGSQARASLIPLLALVASGIVLIPKIWRRASRRTRRKIIFLTLSVSLFSYAGYISAPQSEEWEDDYSYLASANIALGNNNRAIDWAEKAIELNPARNDIKEILVIAQFNKWAMHSKPRSLTTESAKELLENIQQMEKTPTSQSIEAIYLYKLRNIEEANAIWEAQRENSALAQLCLFWTGNISEVTAHTGSHTASPYADLLKEALRVDRNSLEYGSVEQLLDNMLAFAY